MLPGELGVAAPPLAFEVGFEGMEGSLKDLWRWTDIALGAETSASRL